MPIIALTATATGRVRQDVISNLGLGNCKMLTQSFNRPNLTYEVRRKNIKTVTADMAAIIRSEFEGESGIIYCLSRRACEDVADDLSKNYGISAHHYHAVSAAVPSLDGRADVVE